MTARTRKRLLGAALVTACALASAAYGGLGVTPPMPQSRLIPASAPGAVVFSIRNTGSATLEIGSATTPALPACMKIALTPYNHVPPYNLSPGEQAQYVATTTLGFTTTSSCTYQLDARDLSNNQITSNSITVTFNIGSGSGTVSADLQATQIDFGSATTTFEDQAIVLSDYGGVTYGQTYQLSLNPVELSGSLHFTGACSGQTCNITTGSNNGGSAMAVVECEALGSGVITANLEATGSGGFVFGTSQVTCRPGGQTSHIAIAPQPSITLTGPAGVLTGSGSAQVTAMGSGSNMLRQMMISGGTFSFESPTPCAGLGPCTVSLALPQTLWFACTPMTGMAQSATLTVLGAGSNDVASTTLDCVANTTGPVMTVSPNSLGPVASPVGMPLLVPQTIDIGNAGDQILSGIVVSSTSGDWTPGTCTSSNPCSIPVGAPPIHVGVTFTPSAWGNRNATMHVDASNDPMHSATVSLQGTGQGAILNAPSPASYNFGNIPRGQTFSKTFMISETGNAGTMLTLTHGQPQFSTTSSVALPAGGTGMFDVRCMSATSGAFNDTVTITADSAVYMGSPRTVGVTCNVVDTNVTVMPTMLDFGEVRLGSTPPTIEVTLTNMGAADAVLHRVALSDTHGGQLGVSPAISSDVTLPANGGQQKVTLMLGTASEVDLTGTQLLIDVDSANLSPAVDGKVVTFKSHVAPTMLDLGTACVGAQVSGIEMLSNDGTATLDVSQPIMDQGFSAFAQSPGNYPARLAPGTTAVIQIKPAASAVGTVSGTLSWDDDVPSHYQVPVSVEYIPAGTAVSPATLEFGQVKVEVRSDQQTVTVQNCDAAAGMVNVLGVTAVRGPASAWDVEPMGMHVLAPGEKLMLTVAFSPLHDGPYHAQVKLDLNGAPQVVDLYGTGTGGPALDDSFYACSCRGPGGPAAGWPIAVAALAVSRRRRPRATR